MTSVGWLFVFYLGVYLPFVAWRSLRRVSTGGALPSRPRLYASGAFLQMSVLLLAWAAARDEGIVLFSPPRIGPTDVLVGVVWVAVKSARLAWVRRRPAAMAERRMLRHLVPRSSAELAGYAGMVAVASVAEEAAYRGVLFQLAWRAVDDFWVAGAASAAVFGLAHLTQGRRAAFAAGVLGLGNQIVVWLTGSLWIAIAAHFAYDLIVGVGVGRAETG